MWMAWGPDLTFLCNDTYLPTVGLKRDWVIGSRSDKVWAEIWADIGPRIQHVLATWSIWTAYAPVGCSKISRRVLPRSNCRARRARR